MFLIRSIKLRMNELRPSCQVILLLGGLVLLSCANSKREPSSVELARNEREISKKDYGADWPFTVNSGTLKCISYSVIFIANGKSYAVNGAAQNVAQREGYLDMTEIWAPDSLIMKKLMDSGFTKQQAEDSGVKVSVRRIIEDGLNLCE